ncbi:MAG TPA: PTS lactose/cellobiose transporter subunit IIA [Clostridia bacterium]|nr:PTS lactose/cellobiose transporter subunit IIA [Clostridia bacterium]
MDLETMVFTIIAHSGDARSSSMEAIGHAKRGEFDKAAAAMDEANKKLLLVHSEQTKLIQAEAQGQETKLSLLLIHAQDHLMGAMTVRDLAAEFIELYRVMNINRG